MEQNKRSGQTNEKDLDAKYLNQILKTHPFMLYDEVENLKKEINFLEDRIELLENLIKEIKNKQKQE